MSSSSSTPLRRAKSPQQPRPTTSTTTTNAQAPSMLPPTNATGAGLQAQQKPQQLQQAFWGNLKIEVSQQGCWERILSRMHE